MTDRRPRTQQLAVVAGASGLVGRELVLRMLRHPVYARVVALTRRPLGIDHVRLSEVPARYESLETDLSSVVSQTARLDAYCCLGTTISVAGSSSLVSMQVLVWPSGTTTSPSASQSPE